MKYIHPKFFLTVFCFILSPYFILIFFFHPAADDYSYAASTINFGFLNSYIRDYFSWNGRYFSNLFVFYSPLVYGSLLVYRLFIVLLYVLTYVALYFFVRCAFQLNKNKIITHSIALLLLILYVANAPSLFETFYWYTGAVTYQLGIVLLLFNFILLYKYYCNSYVFNKTTHLICLVFSAIMATGCNELLMLLLLIFYSTLFIFNITFKKQNNAFYLMLFLVVLFAAVIVIFAPGNSVRAANFSAKHQLFFSINMSIIQVCRFVGMWLLQPAWWIASVLFLYLSYTYQFKLPQQLRIKSIFFILMMLTVLFVCFFPVYWSTGMLGQHRTVNMSYFLFIIMWFIFIQQLLETQIFMTRFFGKISQKQIKMVLLMLGFSLLLTNNGFTIWSDLLTGRATNYNVQMGKRYSTFIKERSSNKLIVLENINNPISLKCSYDINCDSSYWVNKAYADYYNLSAVKLKQCE